MSQKYGQARRGRQGQYQYSQRVGSRGSPREQHHAYRGPPQSVPPPHQFEGVYANPHLAHSLTTLVGCIVEVKLTSGTVYEGILSAVSPKLEVALQAAHDKAKSATRDNVKDYIQLNFPDIVCVTAKDEVNRRHGASDIFKTDTEISQSNGAAISKDLQPFDFDEGSSVEHLDSDSTGWSVDAMFQVNKERFAVNSTYDEEMVQYTTKLERSDSDNFRQREARAQRIAQEIETKDKSRLGIDDTGTEEEMFSAVVRQEVAPPPSSETTPLHPNGGVSSINSENINVAPPTVGDNSIPKTETTSTGASDSQLSRDKRPSFEATPTLSTTIGKTKLGKDAESAAVEKVTEVKEKDVSIGSNENKSKKVDKQESINKLEEEKTSPVEPQPAADNEKRRVEILKAAISNVETKPTEGVRKFKLDPNAKEFTPASFSLPATPTASPSPAPSTSSSSARSSASTPYQGGKKPYRGGGRQMRAQVSTYYQTEVPTFVPSPSSVAQAGYAVIQTPSFIRPSLHSQPTSGQVFYTPVHQYPGPGGLLTPQPGMMPPQQLMTANPKFVAEIQTQPQVIGQAYPQSSAHQFIPQPTQAMLQQAAVSQAQLVPTHQGLVSAQQPLFNVIQGNLATGTATGGLVGGVPFAQYHHHQALAAAAASAGQTGVTTQQLTGATVTPNRQLFQHQSHQVGK